MKRAAIAVLWTFALWYLGSTLAWFLGVSGPVGPILGIAAGSIALIDPLQAIWVRPTSMVITPGTLSESVATNS